VGELRVPTQRLLPLLGLGCLSLWLSYATTRSRADDAAPADWKIDVSDEGIAVAEADRPVLFYQRKPKSLNGRYERSGYVHPLYDLDGNVLTEDFPDDHRHHRGICWAWHQVLVGQRSVGDGWSIRDLSWDVRDLRSETSAASVTLTADVLWRSPKYVDDAGRSLPLVRESSRIRIHAATADERKIDFCIELRALVADLRLGGSEDDKGYGGFSVRTRLPPDIRFTGAQGEVEPQTNAVAAGSWINMTGTFAGEQRGGLAILCHPSLPGYPQPWILRRSRSMQNPAWPGRHAVPLPVDQPLVLRYRLVIHRGQADGQQIENWQAEYARTTRAGE
jgi:hypothetical protein